MFACSLLTTSKLLVCKVVQAVNHPHPELTRRVFQQPQLLRLGVSIQGLGFRVSHILSTQGYSHKPSTFNNHSLFGGAGQNPPTLLAVVMARCLIPFLQLPQVPWL